MDSKEIFFPYEKIRNEQDSMINEVVDAIKNKKHLIMHAPTGIGKTAAVLGPALKHAIENELTVFFLTSRHTQHHIVIQTLKEIKEKYKADFTAVDLIGKKWMCVQGGAELLRSNEFSEYCKAVREEGKCEFYTRCRDGMKLSFEAKKLIAELEKINPANVELVVELCREEKLCPYEITAAMAHKAKVVIADYNYIFNKWIRDVFLDKTGKKLEKSIIIVDEGHNLPERARNIMTAKLSNFMIKAAIKEAKKFGYGNIISVLASLQDILNKYSSAVSSVNALNSINAANSAGGKKDLLIKMQNFENNVNKIDDYQKIIEDLEFIGDAVRAAQKKSFIAGIAEFLAAWKGDDNGFARIFSVEDAKGGSGDPLLTLLYRCLDPAIITKKVISESYSTIIMSGTLTPTRMYRDLLGFPENTNEREFENPFAEENRLAMVVPETTTKFSLRSEAQFQRIGKICADITESVPGNCAIFFPSYSLRDKIYKYFFEFSSKTAFIEEPGFTKQEKVDMIEKFKAYKDSGAVILGAVTGNFAEGIDLPGDLLKCVIVVGLPLSQPNLEAKELIAYYDKKFQCGWDYGYILPAFIRCLQGAGRCIRSETDRGVVVFLDERYAWPMYARCFPRDYGLKLGRNYKEMIEEFFS